MLALVVLCTAGAACGSEATTAFPDTVCPAIRMWADDLAGAVNAFTDESRVITSEAARRDRYLSTIAAELRRTRALQAVIERAGAPPSDDGELVQVELARLVLDAEANYADELAEARQLPLASFADLEVHDGTLFTSTEKSFGILFHGLTDLANRHDAPEYKACGREGGLGVSLDE